MRALVAIALFFVTCGTAAAGPFDRTVDWLTTGTYAGMSLGSASSDASSQRVTRDLESLRGDPGAFTINTVSVEESGTTWKLYFGKALTEHLAVEVGFADLCDINTVVDADVVDTAAYLQALAQATPEAPGGMTLDLVGRAPLGDTGLHVYARGGLLAWSTSVSYSAGGQTFRYRDDGIGLHAGVGLGWDFTDRVGARLEFEHFGATTTVTQWSLGILFRF